MSYRVFRSHQSTCSDHLRPHNRNRMPREDHSILHRNTWHEKPRRLERQHSPQFPKIGFGSGSQKTAMDQERQGLPRPRLQGLSPLPFPRFRRRSIRRVR